ncbi:hypothetical protein Psi02_34960 [Planotetraspora silvatica]|uniref:Uncharacterized protein n=1 Tax=Planotetraspora silvatica TaxID=234614 RepID=A0A8J3ULA1_9ACTN|nr:hypothetical protein [Planotetraspora silvatica]GII47072.1 hypothetical protein Psi02_34960 [Planotetraspora silvatica]
MGWLTNLLLPGRLRTGPTALLPEKPDPKTLLAIAQLADPDARFDGDDILAGGSRILAAIELDGETSGKLGVTGEEQVWACRLSAETQLPMDYFDKSLAEGIAYRLGGWSMCRGEPTDLADSDLRTVRVYLPAAPSPEEVASLLGEVLRPAADTGGRPDGEPADGIVHVTVDGGVVTDVYAGADMMLTVEEGNRIPPAAKAHWPYLTEIVIMRVSAIDEAALAAFGGRTSTVEATTADEATAAAEGASGAADAEGTATAGTGEENAAEPEAETPSENPTTTGAPEADVEVADLVSADVETGDVETGDAETVAGDTAGDGAADAAADDTAADETVGEDTDEGADGGVDDGADDTALVERAAVALVLASRLQGIATDQGGFQLVEAEDVLPGRYAGQR